MKILRTFLLTSLLAASFATHADVLLMDTIAELPPNDGMGMPRPANGSSMTTVEQRFGAPNSKLGWVGDPPITRWIYDDFTVYFERNLVIHSVVHRPDTAANFDNY